MAEDYTETAFDIERIKAIVWRRLPWLVTPLVLFTPFVLMVIAALPSEYMASSQLWVQEPKITHPLEREQLQRYNPLQRRINLEQRMLSNENLLRTVTELGLDREVLQDTAVESLIAQLKQKVPKLRPGPIDEARLREQLMARLSRRVEFQMLGDQLIQVSYQGVHSSLNARIVNTLVGGFIEDSLRSQRKGTQDQYEFIRKTLDEVKQKLDDSEKRRREFREKHLLDGTPNVDVSTAELRRDIEALSEAEIQHILLQAQLAAVEQEIARHQEEITTQTVTAVNPRAAGLEQEITRLNIELTTLKATLTDVNPRVVVLKETLAELEKKFEQLAKDTVISQVTTSANPIYQNLLQQRTELTPQIEAYKTRIATLDERVKAEEERIRDVPAEEEERLKIERDYTHYLDLYSQLSLQLASADITRELVKEQENTETYKIAKRAEASRIPTGPDRPLLTAMCVVVFLGLGMAVVAALEFIDQSFHNPAQVQNFLKLPMLATIPPIMTSTEIRYRRFKRVMVVALLAAALAVEVVAGLVITNLL